MIGRWRRDKKRRTNETNYFCQDKENHSGPHLSNDSSSLLVFITTRFTSSEPILHDKSAIKHAFEVIAVGFKKAAHAIFGLSCLHHPGLSAHEAISCSIASWILGNPTLNLRPDDKLPSTRTRRDLYSRTLVVSCLIVTSQRRWMLQHNVGASYMKA